MRRRANEYAPSKTNKKMMAKNRPGLLILLTALASTPVAAQTKAPAATPKSIIEKLAVEIARTGRPGAVHLSLPSDCLMAISVKEIVLNSSTFPWFRKAADARLLSFSGASTA